MKQEREREVEKRRTEYEEKINDIRKRREEKDNIKAELYSLFHSNNPQQRGKALESVLNKLFKTFDILIKESFALIGNNSEGIVEQIDGVIEIDNQIFLVEMKWWDKPIGRSEVSEHLVRIFSRGQASGIFISVSDYTEPAITICRESLSKCLIVLIKLEEIVCLLETNGDLKEMLKKKIQAAIHVEAVIKDVAHSVARYGVKMLVLVNGHDANNTSMKYAARELMDELDMPVVYLFYPTLNEIMEEHCETPSWHGMVHACEFETSLMLALKPELVDMSKAVSEYPDKPMLYGKSTISLGDLSKSGVYGDATKASKEKGGKMLQIFIDEIGTIDMGSLQGRMQRVI
ncbi:hypothetical protein EJA13_03740 [Bacillus canaveralius]|nr:hypothetical protein EJA13_03740 [Bacillus canaveralius]